MILNVVLLRKMTLKSSFNEGKYAGIPIGQLINFGNTRYLRHVYYYMSNIDYIQEVKDAIGITKEFEINKPGVNILMMDKLVLEVKSITIKGTE